MKARSTTNRYEFHLLLAALLGLFASGAIAPGTLAAIPQKKTDAVSPSAEGGNRLAREGLVVEFSAKPVVPVGPGGATRTTLMAGDHADVTFRITDAVSGQPVQGLYPGVWMDVSKPWNAKKDIQPMDCKQRVGMYLQGLVGIRPLIDLNSYFVMVLNQDPSITVIDPLVGITGITKLYAQINLQRPGADWAKTEDDKRLFVTMPRADMVAVVDTETFKVAQNVKAGTHPVRVAVQADEKYLWVGNDSKEAAESGVTVLDVETLSKAAFIVTGKGHHEIAISADSRYAFVSNRHDGTVSVIDVQRLEKVKDVKTGPLPISLAFSSLSQALYVGDGQTGAITVVDGKAHKTLSTIQTKSGLGPLRFSQDGRWGMTVNSHENVVYVIDASTNRLAYTIPVGAQPYQVAFSRAFAYVRSLGTERVSMIELAKLGGSKMPPVVSFPVGAKAPGKAADLSITDGIMEAPGEAAVLVVSPADMTVYYYMEGMNAPMGNFRNYGHLPRAVTVADRAMREKAPGVYTGSVRIPEAGTYDVAFLLDTPRILHCFSAAVKPNPMLKRTGPPLEIKYLIKDRRARVGETVLRFRLTDPESHEPRTALGDVRVLYYRAPGYGRTEVPAREVGDGIYEATVSLPHAGAYFVYVASPSVKVRYGDLPYLTLRAVKAKAAASTPAQAEDTRGQKTSN